MILSEKYPLAWAEFLADNELDFIKYFDSLNIFIGITPLDSAGWFGYEIKHKTWYRPAKMWHGDNARQLPKNSRQAMLKSLKHCGNLKTLKSYCLHLFREVLTYLN